MRSVVSSCEADNTWQDFLSIVVFRTVYHNLYRWGCEYLTPTICGRVTACTSVLLLESFLGSGNTCLVEEAVGWPVPFVPISSVLLRIVSPLTRILRQLQTAQIHAFRGPRWGSLIGFLGRCQLIRVLKVEEVVANIWRYYRRSKVRVNIIAAIIHLQ
jgi:hypothetical protein